MTQDACLNCETALDGEWCHRCGQRAQTHHRSLKHVLFEAIELVTHADSRLWQTLSGLTLHPAQLTRDYIEGKRAGQIPPLRLFFVMLLLLFGLGSLSQHGANLQQLPLDKTMLASGLRAAHVSGGLARWAQTHILRAAADPSGFRDIVSAWAERFAFLMLPVATLLLGLIFIADRRFTMFDHVIFSLHSLCFCVLLLSVVAAPIPVLDASRDLLLLLLPVHLFVHMRGVYGTHPPGTLWRMAVLGAGSALGMLVLVGSLALLGLQFVHG